MKSRKTDEDTDDPFKIYQKLQQAVKIERLPAMYQENLKVTVNQGANVITRDQLKKIKKLQFGNFVGQFELEDQSRQSSNRTVNTLVKTAITNQSSVQTLNQNEK